MTMTKNLPKTNKRFVGLCLTAVQNVYFNALNYNLIMFIHYAETPEVSTTVQKIKTKRQL